MPIVLIQLKVVQGVASISTSTAYGAIGQLQYLFTQSNMSRYVADRADAVVQAIVTQTSLIRSRHLNDMNGLDELSELVRIICNFISVVRSFRILYKIHHDTY
ncbi:unnamed protein product [Anisakis simplex]|uniref:ABC transmembrane type-1 domain-containing protein n=1 Tax=Anisakis simplex TaxID=6269 RepID=A0A0M3JFM6_ANISI|nr:unnamed protein product [Anisakis simplex]